MYFGQDLVIFWKNNFYQPLLYRFPHKSPRGSYKTVFKNLFWQKSYFLTPNRILVMKNDFKIHFDTLVMFRIHFGLQKYILNGFWTDFVNFFKIKNIFINPCYIGFHTKVQGGHIKPFLKIYFDKNRIFLLQIVFLLWKMISKYISTL